MPQRANISSVAVSYSLSSPVKTAVRYNQRALNQSNLTKMNCFPLNCVIFLRGFEMYVGFGGCCCPCRLILLFNTPCGVKLQLDIYQTPPSFLSSAVLKKSYYIAIMGYIYLTLCFRYCHFK